MGRKILAISLLLVMVLSFTACGEELPTAQEIVDGAVRALDDVTSYQFEMTTTMDVSGESEGEAFEGATATDQSGTLDLANRQMHTFTTMNTVGTGTYGMDRTQETYIIDDMVYTMTVDTPDSEPSWMKSEMPAELWEQMNQIKPQIEILGTSAVEIVGSEQLDGVDCYVLESTPDTEQLWQLFMQQMGTASDMAPDITMRVLDEMCENYSAKQWIAKDSYFLMKVEVEISMELTPEIMGSPEEEGEAAVAIRIIMLVYDYNQPVSIELPPEAEEAIEVPIYF